MVDRQPIKSSAVVLCVYLVMAVLALWPVLSVEIPPLVDYPNHLARMHVLATQGSDDIVQQNYEIMWRPVPNLAMDIIVPPLTAVMSVVDAGRVFLSLSFLCLIAGLCALHRVAFGTVGLTPIVGFLLLYNLPFAWGFLNFYFSIGVCLLVFAGWLASRDWSPPLRVLVFNGATALLYLSHMFGFAAYCCAVFFHEIRTAIAQRDFGPTAILQRALVACGQIILPASLFAANGLLWGENIETVALGSWFGDVGTKGAALLAAGFFYGGTTDILVLAFAIFTLTKSLRMGWLEMAPLLRWPVAGFVVLTLASPHVLQGLFLDARIGVFLAFLVAASLRLRMPSGPAILVSTATVAVFAIKMFAVTQVWRSHDETYQSFRSALPVIEPGARVLSSHDIPGARAELNYSTRWRMNGITGNGHLSHLYADRGLINLAVLERGAFVPSLFTFPSTQPLRSAAHNLHIDPIQPARRVTTALLIAGADPEASAILDQTAKTEGERAFWLGWPKHFDYVIVFREISRVDNPASQYLSLVTQGPTFDIYRVTGKQGLTN